MEFHAWTPLFLCHNKGGFRDGHPVREELCVMRVFCDSCNHAHAIPPDCIIPYSSYSRFFILRLLGKYSTGLCSVERLCEKFGITLNQLYKWLSLWKEHKREWLGLLADGLCTGHLHLLTTRSWDGHPRHPPLCCKKQTKINDTSM